VVNAKDVRCSICPYWCISGLTLLHYSMVLFASAYRIPRPAFLPSPSRTRKTAFSSMFTLQPMRLMETMQMAYLL
jgi:hypothetical protein